MTPDADDRAGRRRAAAASRLRRLAAALYRRPRLQLLLLLRRRLGWFGVVYFGSLALLLVTAFWTLDPATARSSSTFTLDNFQQLLTQPRLPDDRAAGRSASPPS